MNPQETDVTRENTQDTVVSSPPSFMTETPTPSGVDPAKAEEKVENGKATAVRAVAREEAAQDKDAMDKRQSTLDKATGRIKELTDYAEKIDKAIASVLPEFCALHPMGQVLDTFALLEDEAEALDKMVKSINNRLSMAREVSLPERMDAEETRTFTAESGNRITRTVRLFASMDPTAGAVPDGGEIVSNNHGLQPGSYPELVGMPLGYVWLKQNELGSLIKPTVNSSSLSAAAKELLGQGRELPEELFRTHNKDSVSITRKKAK